jgi:hypothetical protein
MATARKMPASFDYYTPADQWPTFEAWVDAQRDFYLSNRKEQLEECGHMIVVPYAYCPNVAEIRDQSNHEAIETILAEADPSGESYSWRYHGHWATPYDMLLVEPGSAAFEAMDRAIAALADYPVLDESDFSERECEAQYESVLSELGGPVVVVGADGAELDSDAYGDLASEICSTANDTDCMYRSDVESALEAMGYEQNDDNEWYQATTMPAGTTVDVEEQIDPHGKLGISYPAFRGTLLEACTGLGFNVVRVHSEDGAERRVFSRSVSFASDNATALPSDDGTDE